MQARNDTSWSLPSYGVVVPPYSSLPEHPHRAEPDGILAQGCEVVWDGINVTIGERLCFWMTGIRYGGPLTMCATEAVHMAGNAHRRYPNGDQAFVSLVRDIIREGLGILKNSDHNPDDYEQCFVRMLGSNVKIGTSELVLGAFDLPWGKDVYLFYPAQPETSPVEVKKQDLWSGRVTVDQKEEVGKAKL